MSALHTDGDLGTRIGNMLRGMTAPRTLIYPGYIAKRIKDALCGHDPERIVMAVGPIETVGDCKYAIRASDFNGSVYKITVEVEHTAGDPLVENDAEIIA